MILYKVLALVCALISITSAIPTPVADNGFSDFLQNTPSKESVLVKRRIFEDNADKQLKQISLSSLVEDLEKNIFASALSFNKVLTNKKASVPEIKDNIDSEHDVNKRQTLKKEQKTSESAAITTTTTTESSDALPMDDKMILQTADKVTVPTRIVIDRIAIQPHTEGLALIPIFELKQNKKKEASTEDREITKITISKTEITGSVTAPVNTYTSNYVSVPSANATTEASLIIGTTPKNIEELKEAAEVLKEKFAEIEAEPIILSARV